MQESFCFMKPIFTGRKIAYLLSLSAILTFLLPLALNAFPAAARQSSFFKNVFFVNITFMGDALFAFALAFVLLFFFDRKRHVTASAAYPNSFADAYSVH